MLLASTVKVSPGHAAEGQAITRGARQLPEGPLVSDSGDGRSAALQERPSACAVPEPLRETAILASMPDALRRAAAPPSSNVLLMDLSSGAESARRVRKNAPVDRQPFLNARLCKGFMR
jgi:hypothetical protein